MTRLSDEQRSDRNELLRIRDEMQRSDPAIGCLEISELFQPPELYQDEVNNSMLQKFGIMSEDELMIDGLLHQQFMREVYGEIWQ